MITLRPHQIKCKQEIYESLNLGYNNVLAVLPTGAGKTLIKASITKDYVKQGKTVILFAHRDVLLGQISKSLCLMKVKHSFIASVKAVKNITNANVEDFNDSFNDETSRAIVASVPTFLQRLKKGTLNQLLPMCNLWLLDEAHHMVNDSMWDKCTRSLINAKGIGVTATPVRCDGKGLGSIADGRFDKLVVGANMGELIQQGYLSPYKIFVPPTILDVSNVKITSGGDFNQKSLHEATDKHQITGDAVSHYLSLAEGSRAITFTVNIAHAEHVAKEFNLNGVPSVALSSNSSEIEIRKGLKAFTEGKILNLVNCDLFGEGYDCPSVACVIMLRKTESYGLFKQQFGRCLRVAEDKHYGILIDHVGNVTRHCTHGEPHDDPAWTLLSSKSMNVDATVKIGRICPNCFSYYVPTIKNKFVCKDCNHEETKDETNKRQLEFQANDGKLVEMTVDFIENLMRERNKVDQDVSEFKRNLINAPMVVRNSAVNRHIRRLNAQFTLRDKIQKWCEKLAIQTGFTPKIIQREFERTYGVNILKAQVLSERLALDLIDRIKL